MNVDRYLVFQAFKYLVYALLAINVGVFFAEEWAAVPHRFVDGVGINQIIEAYAATIDTAAWVILLLMFELETCILEERHYTPAVSWLLRGIRAFCYAIIVYAFFGYLTKLIFLLGATPLSGVTDLCSLVDGRWSYAVDLDEYVVLSNVNCQSFSPANSFVHFVGTSAAVDTAGYRDILGLAWVDVINAGVWLLVVIVLELDVKLQHQNLLAGNILKISNLSKYVMYTVLLLAAIYWGINGDFVDFWDAFLWLVAFVLIELNVFEWRQESQTLTEPA